MGQSLRSPASTSYPNPQALDADFDGSYLSPDLREVPLHGAAFVTRWAGAAPPQPWLLTTLPPKRHEPVHQRPEDGVKIVLRRCWDCFRPRERSLPTGDGTEGGVFHKTFEFRLPGGC